MLCVKGDYVMSILAAVAVPHPPILLPEIGQGEESSPHSVIYRDYIQISPGESAKGAMGAGQPPNG